MEQLGVFKILEDDTLELCGFYNSREEAIKYLEMVKKEVIQNCQNSLMGEYICIPMLYFKIDNKTK